MAEQVEITLARALKLKNRLAGRLAKLDGDFENYNSVPAGADRPDLRVLYTERNQLVVRLVELKVALNATNQPMQRTIFELGEAKSLVALLTKTSTKHGTVVEGYHGTEVEYTAQFRKADIDREVRRLEVVIDRLQEQLDAFNHRTVIGIDAELLREIEATPPPPGAGGNRHGAGRLARFWFRGVGGSREPPPVANHRNGYYLGIPWSLMLPSVMPFQDARFKRSRPKP